MPARNVVPGCRAHPQLALKDEFERNENVYKHVAMQEAEERRLRDEELERMRLQWLEQMKVCSTRVYTLRSRGGGLAGRGGRLQPSAAATAG